MQTTIKPYGQFYRCHFVLFKNLVRDVLFMHLLNEHMALVRTGKEPIVSVQSKKLESATGINRGIIPHHLSILDSMGVIKLAEGSCIVKADYFVSIVTLYHQQETSELRNDVCNAFRNHDLVKLQELGLRITNNGNEELMSLTGSPTQENSCVHINTMSINKHNVDISTECGYIDIVSMYKHKSNFFQLLTDAFSSKNDYIYTLCRYINTQNAHKYVQEIAEYVFDNKSASIEDLDEAIYGLLGEIMSFLCLHIDTGVSIHKHKTNETCRYIDTVNKYINKQKNEQANEVSLLYKGENKNEEDDENFEEGQKDYLGFFGKVNSDLISQPLSEKDEEDDNEDFNRSEKASERHEKSKAFRESVNPCRNKPYYKEEELSDFLENYEDCTSSQVKFWLWLVFDEMVAYYSSIKYPDDSDDTDEYGEATDEDMPDVFIKDLEGFLIDSDILTSYMDKFYREICKAYQDGKYVFTTGDKIELPKMEVEDFHDQLPFIFDWKKVVDEFGKKCMVVSLKKVRDIEATNISQIDTSMSKESVRTRNRQNRAYTKAIRETDDSQLSNIEKAMKSFAETFVLFNEDGDIYWTTDGMGNRSNDISIPGQETPDKMVAWRFIQPWLHTLGELGITKEDFFDMLNTKNTYKEGTTIDLRFINGLFSYQKSKQWHEINQIEDGVWQRIPSE